jgi:hypothetical protein
MIRLTPAQPEARRTAPARRSRLIRTEKAMPDVLKFRLTSSAPEDLAPAATGARDARLLSLARMTGSSIAGRDAAAWVTDFLDAAYYRRASDAREVDDLRLAFAILTTYWWYQSRGRDRLGLADLSSFHRAFGADRFATTQSARGTLSRGQLLDGAARLLGDWFPEAYADDARRAWGIAFRSPADRLAYDPDARLRLAPVGRLTPESAAPSEQVWHTYPPVAMPPGEQVIAALTAPETWPDYASEIGRFTPLRPGGLAGQTFEIEVAAGTDAGRPVFTRGYVTITKLVTPADPAELAAWFAALEDALRRFGRGEPRAVPHGGEPLVGFDLTTHAGHFMGSGHNRLAVYRHGGRTWVRAVGTWDPMSWTLRKAYAGAGQAAQAAFWGAGGSPAKSMLHQLALRIA